MISVVISVCRAEKNLAELHCRLLSVFSDIDNVFEIIFVEGCGDDKSWQILTQLVSVDSHVCEIKLDQAEIIRRKGSNRSQVLHGQVENILGWTLAPLISQARSLPLFCIYNLKKQ